MKALLECRDDFPMLMQTMHGKPLVYLDSAATTQKPKVVIEAINDFYSKHYGTVHRSVYELAMYATSAYNQVRNAVCQFINAQKPEEIIFTRGTTEAINMVAYSFGKAYVKAGDEVIISAIEHHSNIVPWQMMCEDRQAYLKVIPVDDNGELIIDEYVKLLSEKTKIVAVNHVSNSLGTINPIKAIIDLAHKSNTKVLIDGAQSAPHMTVDVQALDADFYVFSGHKVYGPTGIGILYGKEKLLDEMPPAQGGGDMIKEVTFEKTTYNDLPLKFEAGTPMIAEVIGLGAAISYLQQFGIDNIYKWEYELARQTELELKKIPGLHIIGNAKEKGAIISFIVEGIHHLDIGAMLDLKGVAVRTGHHCTQPIMKRFDIPGTVRVSFGMYNSLDDIDVFLKSLTEVTGKLKG